MKAKRGLNREDFSSSTLYAQMMECFKASIHAAAVETIEVIFSLSWFSLIGPVDAVMRQQENAHGVRVYIVVITTRGPAY